MKRYDTAKIRNIALVGHGGTGKTSLGDAILYTAGTTNRLGSVDHETSAFDVEPEEVRRKTSYSSGVASVEYKGFKVNVVDTPGDGVFAADTRLCMFATDVTVLLVSGVDGIEVGSSRAWASAEELEKPRIVYVGKMDKERADFGRVVDELRATWGQDVAALQIPIGSGPDFDGVVDVLHMRSYRYSSDAGTATVGEVPADLADAANAARETLIEAIASTDDDLLEKYLETMELSQDEVLGGLKTAVASGALVPVLCGSARKNFGTDALLDMLVDAGPGPADVAGPEAVRQGETIRVSADSDQPFVGVAFKAAYVDMGKVCYVRVFQGRGDPDQTFQNLNRDVKERWGQVMAPQGKRLDHAAGAAAGDIIAVAKLKETVAGDVLCGEKETVRLITPTIPEPCISFALEAEKKGDEDKIANALSRVLDCDPSLVTSRDQQTRDHLLSGMGQTHIEVAVEKMRRFGGAVTLSPPHVAYRECIKGRASGVEGKHKKQSGGRGQYGVCFIDMEPAARGEGFVFEDKIFGGAIPSNFIPSVEKGLKEAMNAGPLAGYPVVDVKVRLMDGKYHSVDSDGRSFEAAARLAFRAAFQQAKPTLLEPIMSLEVTVPDDAMGDVMGDINSRRGRVQGMDTRKGRSIIHAQVPQAEVLTYAPDLRSLTGGRGSFTMKFARYDEVPSHLVGQIVADRKQEEEH